MILFPFPPRGRLFSDLRPILYYEITGNNRRWQALTQAFRAARQVSPVIHCFCYNIKFSLHHARHHVALHPWENLSHSFAIATEIATVATGIVTAATAIAMAVVMTSK